MAKLVAWILTGLAILLAIHPLIEARKHKRLVRYGVAVIGHVTSFKAVEENYGSQMKDEQTKELRKGRNAMQHYWQTLIAPLDNTLDRILAFVPRIVVACLLFLLFYGLARMVSHILTASLNRIGHIPWAVRVLMGRLIHLTLLFIGLLVALSAINVNITALLTSLGVAGFALGFALKDILENFLAGILLLFAHPFEVGDQVKLGDFEGTVQDIQIRTTTVQTYNNDLVALPNSRVYTNPIINHTRAGKRAYHVDFDTSLSADTHRIEQEVVRMAAEHPDILDEPAPFAILTGVATGSDVLSWRLIFWAGPTKGTEVKTTSAILHRIKKDLFDHGVPTPANITETILRSEPIPSSNGVTAH